MNKRSISIILIIAMCFCLSACCLSHDWQEATCTAPKTCAKCGKTEGNPLPHTWNEATCTKPKTCSVCGETEGEPLGHEWIDATCTEPKTCSECGETEGKALGHQASPATCTEDSVCSRCGMIIEKATGHAWMDATAGKPKTCKNCGLTEGDPLGYSYFPMDSYEFVDAYNRSEHALGTLSKNDGNEMRIAGTNIRIIFFVSDAAVSSKYEGAWKIPKMDFNVMAIRMVTKGNGQYDTTSLSAITLIGQSFAEILDPTFDWNDFIENSNTTYSTDKTDITLTYSHNGFEYTLKTFGGTRYYYDFIITLSANNE